MNKGERQELRGIIRRRMKVLRADIETRRRELYVEIDEQLTAEYQADLKRWADTQFIVAEAVREANRKVNDAYREFFGREMWGDTADKRVVAAVALPGPKEDRSKERGKRRAAVDARVAAAYVELDRREADLMEELATGALESAEAKQFLARIPTVAELVPASRLQELTAQVFDGEDR